MADANWLPDPSGAHELRYWNGSSWTEHVSDQGTTGQDPGTTEYPPPAPAFPPPPPPPPAVAPPGGYEPPAGGFAPPAGGFDPAGAPPAGGFDPAGAPAAGAPPAGAKLSWKDRLKQVADQGKAMADQGKQKLAEQQAKRTEQWANDPSTLWFGESKNAATSAAGVSKARYRITKDRVWIESGLLGTRTESVPLWSIRDMDVRQAVWQRGKDIGDVVLNLEDPAYGATQDMFNMTGNVEGTTSGQVVLDNIESPYSVLDLLSPLISEARSKKTIERQSQYLHVNPGMAAAGAAFGAPRPGPGRPTAAGRAAGGHGRAAAQARRAPGRRDPHRGGVRGAEGQAAGRLTMATPSPVTALVTGATGGIGSAVVRMLAARGHRVLAAARPSESLDALCAAVPSTVAAPVDLRRPEELPDAVRELDRLDVLVHAAGVSDVATVADTPPDVWAETMAANVTGPAELTRAVLPALRAARGRVVFINAVAGLHAVPRWSAYTASKAALTELADSLRLEEAPHGVRVTSIYPGGIATELLRKVRGALGTPYDPATCVSPDELAAVIATVLDAPAAVDIIELALRPTPR